MVVSQLPPNSVIVANCLLVAVPLALVVVEVYKYWIVALVFPGYVCLYLLNASVSWCRIDDLVWGDDNAPRLGA